MDPANTDYMHLQNMDKNLLLKNRSLHKANLVGRLQSSTQRSGSYRPRTTNAAQIQSDQVLISQSVENFSGFELGFRNGTMPSTPKLMDLTVTSQSSYRPRPSTSKMYLDRYKLNKSKLVEKSSSAIMLNTDYSESNNFSFQVAKLKSAAFQQLN